MKNQKTPFYRTASENAELNKCWSPSKIQRPRLVFYSLRTR